MEFSSVRPVKVGGHCSRKPGTYTNEGVSREQAQVEVRAEYMCVWEPGMKTECQYVNTQLLVWLPGGVCTTAVYVCEGHFA